jgi:aminoglycoside/choline kinase family phosphotransferase
MIPVDPHKLSRRKDRRRWEDRYMRDCLHAILDDLRAAQKVVPEGSEHDLLRYYLGMSVRRISSLTKGGTDA